MRHIQMQSQRFGCLLLICSWSCYAPARGEEPVAQSEKQPVAEIVLQQEATARRKLQEKSSFDFEETPLNEVMAFLADQHDLDILLDERHMADEGISLDYPLSLKVDGISLKSGLKLMLEPISLTYVIEESAILITSQIYAEKRVVNHVYPVRDLIQFKDADGRIQQDEDVLLEMITSIVQPNTWSAVGGPGSLDIYQGMLLVNQTSDLQMEVEGLLATLRKFPSIDNPQAESSPRKVRVSGEQPQDDECNAALDKVIPLEFHKTPLRDVVAYLNKETGVPFLLDKVGLRDEGIGEDEPVTFKSKSLTVRTALRIALRQFTLTIMVRDGVIMVTSQQVLEEEPVTVIYQVRDLLDLPDSPEREDYAGAFDDLVYAITTLVHPNTWDSVGGPGSIGEYLQRGVLVVSTTGEIQEEVETFLERISQGREELGEEASSQPGGLNEMEVVVYGFEYALPTVNEKSGLPESPAPEHIDSEKLRVLIPELLGPEVWGEDPQVMIQSLPDRLVVKHTRRVQRQVHRLLVQLGVKVWSNDEETQIPMGMGGASRPASVGGSFFNVPGE